MGAKSVVQGGALKKILRKTLRTNGNLRITGYYGKEGRNRTEGKRKLMHLWRQKFGMDMHISILLDFISIPRRPNFNKM